MTEKLAVILPCVVGFLVALRMTLLHIEKMGDSANKKIQSISESVANHVNEVKLVTTALNDKLTQLANRRQ